MEQRTDQIIDVGVSFPHAGISKEGLNNSARVILFCMMCVCVRACVWLRVRVPFLLAVFSSFDVRFLEGGGGWLRLGGSCRSLQHCHQTETKLCRKSVGMVHIDVTRDSRYMSARRTKTVVIQAIN